MTRTKLLATSAVVAFVAATGVSMAQQERGAPAEKAPAEKMAPSGAKQPSAAQRQGGEAQNAPAGRKEGPSGREAQQNRGRSETTGQAPRENRSGERNAEQERGQSEQRSKSDRNEQKGAAGQTPREDRANRSSEQNRTTGQAPREDRSNRSSEQNRTTGQAPREDRTNRSSEQNRLEQDRARTDRTEENRATTGQGAAGTRTNVNVNLTPEKRTQIHEVIVQERSAPRVNNVNFNLSVGTRVPSTVRFVALPRRIVEIEPSWRGFEYFMVGDQIVIVDPKTMEIVAVLDA
jgi:hypothetical protein